MCPCNPSMLVIWLPERSSIYNDMIVKEQYSYYQPVVTRVFLCSQSSVYYSHSVKGSMWFNFLAKVMQTKFSSLSGKQSRLVILSILLFDRSRCVKWMRFCNLDISVSWLALNSVNENYKLVKYKYYIL